MCLYLKVRDQFQIYFRIKQTCGWAVRLSPSILKVGWSAEEFHSWLGLWRDDECYCNLMWTLTSTGNIKAWFNNLNKEQWCCFQKEKEHSLLAFDEKLEKHPKRSMVSFFRLVWETQIAKVSSTWQEFELLFFLEGEEGTLTKTLVCLILTNDNMKEENCITTSCAPVKVVMWKLLGGESWRWWEEHLSRQAIQSRVKK